MTPGSWSTRPRSSTGAGAPGAQRSSGSDPPRRRSSSVSDRGSESENPAIDSPTPETSRPRTNQDWWPNQLDLSVLHRHSSQGDPMDADFDYATEVRSLDV